MHALITADTLGGVWTYVRELVTGLSRRGVRVTLVSFGEIPTGEQIRWMEPLADVDFRPTAFKLEWMQDSAEDIVLSSEYLAAIVREVRPDVLHLNQYCYGNLDVDVPRIVVAHSDVVSWWHSVHGEDPPASEWTNWYRETVRSGLEGATAVVAPSKWMMDELCANFAKPCQTVVIYNGRNRNLFNPHITKEKYILGVGRVWDAGKQLSILRKIDAPMPVMIAGQDIHPDAALGVGGMPSTSIGNVQFRGVQNEVQLRNLYSRAAIFVATSCYEPFGLAAVEAALSRCAIVANDIPTFRELWGDTVCYFNTNDAGDLERVLRRLCTEEAERQHYARLAFQHARKAFSSDRMVEQYVEVYKSAVAAEATAA